MKTTHYTTTKPGSELSLAEHKLELTTQDVLVRVTHCGVCHSDLDFIDNTFGDSQFPVVPGHEIVGLVESIGEDVKHFQPGERVGVSWQLDSCGHCHWCAHNDETLCADFKAIGINRFGGFASHVTANEKFVHHIPEEIDSAHAAPLLCAGSTVMTAIEELQLKAGMKIGVIGMGGLGHLAVQFLNKLGCDVTVFEIDADKRHDAIQFGAHDFFSDRFSETVPPKNLQRHFDYLIATADTAINLDQYIQLLKPRGQLCFLGMPNKAMTLPLFNMMIYQRSIIAVPLGGPKMIKKTFAFADKHNIHPTIEALAMTEVNQALTRLREHAPRYRIVLQNPPPAEHH